MSSVLAVAGAARGCRLGARRALVRLLAPVEEEGDHEKDGSDEAPEEDALVAGDHREDSWRRRGCGRASELRAATMAFATVC